MVIRRFGKALVAFALAASISVTGIGPAHAAAPIPTPVGYTSGCQDVVVLGAEGSGQTFADDKGFGPQAWLGLTAYAQHMEGYNIGYFTVPYPSAPLDAIALMTASYRDTYFESIDDGVKQTLEFLKQRVDHCQKLGVEEHYVLMGYSQGAMVMHRALWQLTQPTTKYPNLGAQVLPLLDGILAIADGDRVSSQGGASMDTAGSNGYGVWWAGGSLIAKAEYPPLYKPIPDLGEKWSPARFHSVCHSRDIVCDTSNLGLKASGNRLLNAFLQAKNAAILNEGIKIHTSYYGPGGDSDVYVRSAATNISKTSKAVNPKTPEITAVPVRVGQKARVVLVADGYNVASVEWLSSPLPNTQIALGAATIPATLTWSPTAPGIVDYSVRVNFTDAPSKDISGSLQAFAVPAPSLSATNLQTSYSPASLESDPYSTISFDVTKTTPSGTTPSKIFTDREDSATDYYQYTSGDSNGNGLLDTGESWSYTARIRWDYWEPSNVRTRTVLIKANDTTGAGAWIEIELPVTLSR